MKHTELPDDYEKVDYEIDYAAIGNRIRIERIKLGISQATLAEKIDISTTHMSHIETGSTKLSLATFIRLTETLNVLADKLLFPAPEGNNDSVVADVVKCLNTCNDKELSVVSDVVKTTVSSLQKNFS